MTWPDFYWAHKMKILGTKNKGFTRIWYSVQTDLHQTLHIAKKKKFPPTYQAVLQKHREITRKKYSKFVLHGTSWSGLEDCDTPAEFCRKEIQENSDRQTFELQDPPRHKLWAPKVLLDQVTCKVSRDSICAPPLIQGTNGGHRAMERELRHALN